MGWGSSFGMGKDQFVGGLARAYGKDKKKRVGKILGKAGRDTKKITDKWGKTNEGKLLKGLVGGYMKHRKQINRGLSAIHFAD